ncbi:MAG: hypothetical protein E7409_02540 [Ruminococcaceae bacterium]|nr:hypothetical protein [Oscillospiraceae bacterium]
MGRDNLKFKKEYDIFSYQVKSGQVSTAEQISWWNDAAKRYAYDMDVVREAGIAVYELNKKLAAQTQKANAKAQKQAEQARKQAERERKERIKAHDEEIARKEDADKRWNEYQLASGQMSEKEFAGNLKARADRYRAYAEDLVHLKEATKEERLELENKYIAKAEELETEHAKRIQALRKEAAEIRNMGSLEYVTERAYQDDWRQFGDTPQAAFERFSANNRADMEAGLIDEQEYAKRVETFGQKMYRDRITASNIWLKQEQLNNRITADEYVDGLERMLEYTREYYAAGMIGAEEYAQGVLDIEEQIFAKRKEQHRQYLAEIKERKDAVDESARTEIEALEKQYERKRSAKEDEQLEEELSELRAQERLYKNAQTREGKERLEDIRAEIGDITERLEDNAAKAQLESRKDQILASAEAEKGYLEALSEQKAQELGLIYANGTYLAMQDVQTAFSEAAQVQSTFAKESTDKMRTYQTGLGNMLLSANQAVADAVLEQFSIFSQSLSAMRAQIAADLTAINGMQMGQYGAKTVDNRTSTSITINDYGTKRISGISGAQELYGAAISALMAKGVKW